MRDSSYRRHPAGPRRRLDRRVAIAALLAAFSATEGLAQTASVTLLRAVPGNVISAPPLQPGAAAPATPGTADAAPGSAAPTEGKSRLARIQALPIDRRPSTLLAPPETKPPGGEKGGGQKIEADSFDAELAQLAADVRAGRWDAVVTIVRSLPAEESTAAVDRLLDQLGADAAQQPGPTGIPLPAEPAAISATDFAGILRMVPPGTVDEARRRRLGTIARKAIEAGTEGDDLATVLLAESRRDGTAVDARVAAGVLADAGRADLAGPILPAIADAIAARDATGLELVVKQRVAARQRAPREMPLEEVWKGVEALVDVSTPGSSERRYGIERAAELLPQIPEADADAWLAMAAVSGSARELVATIAARVAAGPQREPHDVETRTQALRLLHSAVGKVLADGGGDGDDWRGVLALAARAWSAEAKLSAAHDTRDVGMRRDPYGNVYYWEEQQLQMQRMQQPQWPVKLADTIAAAPSDAWLARIPADERAAVDRNVVAVRCKAGEVAAALPALERLAAAHPAAARELVPPLLDAWKVAHDPNDERVRRMPFFYAFGMEQRQGGIPLSRSQQERNLDELESLVCRLKAMPIGPLDERLLVDCFTTCHSDAEVWRKEAIERVLGPAEAVAPTASARLAERMRSNLAGTWQRPSVQEAKKTKRREADIRAEVERGYVTARQFLAEALVRHPGHWALEGAAAALDHDENDFRRKIADSPDFTRLRRAALDRFAAAGQAYAAATATMPREDWSDQLLQSWFLAACGACDAGRIDESTQAVTGESAKIAAVVEGMEPEPRQWHRERFATTLVGRLAQLNPAVKARVVREGLVIAGDEPKAREARQVADYYGDLVREIRLVAAIDGPDRVGTGRPFGVLVSLRHTREIEREAGGFGRYLQNQKASTMFSFNFGRPLENYRDKFEEMARRTLGESFEVKSVTFQSEDVQSRADDEYGWRRTPYAYLVLVAKDPKIDRLPPLRLDLDFLDSGGYVILPVESPAVGLDAGHAESRPFSRLAVTEVLDERKAAEGMLTLEVRTSARGLVPELETILSPAPSGWKAVRVRDDGLSVARFDPESDEPAVSSERTWTVDLEAAGGDGTFTFPEPTIETTELVRQRYEDADLVAAEPTLVVGRRAAAWHAGWRYGLPALAAICGALAIAAMRRAKKRPGQAALDGFTIPDPPTPFAVLQLLRDIQAHDGLDARGHATLAESIDQIESRYFGGAGADDPVDLAGLARDWVSRARRRSGAGHAT